MTESSLGAGDVRIDLLGEKVTLRPNLRAAQVLSKQSGGILAALQAVARFDLEVITSTIALGLGKTAPKEITEVGEKVYATGLVDLVEPVSRYLSNLANGGRPQATTEDGSGAEHPPGS